MDTEEEKRFIQEIKEAIAKSRGYADSFKYSPNRDLEELGIVKRFCEALEKEEESFLDSTTIISRGHGNDPPDCEAKNFYGDLVGIEVTELVDPDAIVALKKNQVYEWAEWSETKLIDAINNRLDVKDTPSRIRGGPYANYILIIHTDEPVLNVDYAKALLKEYRFSKRILIDRAFLFIFYDPIYKTYPYIELEFKNS